MLEQKYSTTSMTELIKMVLLEGNLEALMECQNRVRGFEYDMTTIHPLDALLLYYVDLVWMPEDLRHDFVDLHGFIIMDIKNILTNHQYKNLKDVQDLYVLLFSLNNEMETDEDVHLCDLQFDYLLLGNHNGWRQFNKDYTEVKLFSEEEIESLDMGHNIRKKI